ncbi:MAG: lipoate--protein ligase family protein [Aeropyrum sp.]|nr:lipoate--protein ligase family protein [Aeropyrum sp.]
MKLRVVVDGPRDPRLNMAIDEALLLAGRTPTLRIYQWFPTGVSIGRRQRSSDINLAEARRRGYVVVRRPTGGAALIHPWKHEVTYSIVIDESHPIFQLDVAHSAAIIAQGVAYALEKLGLHSMIGGFRGFEVEGGLCYVRPGSSDVVVLGRKVSGSAQRRIRGRLLQHGTVLLRFDADEWSSIIPLGGVGPEDLRTKIAGIEQILGRSIDFEEITKGLVEGFARVLGVPSGGVEYSSLEPQELSIALKLFEEKYMSYDWNLRGW